MGHQEVERKLADLRGHVKWLKEKLHKEGNWHVAKVTQARRDDNTNVCEQDVEARPIWNITPAARRVVKSLAPRAIHFGNIYSFPTQSVRSDPTDISASGLCKLDR